MDRGATRLRRGGIGTGWLLGSALALLATPASALTVADLNSSTVLQSLSGDATFSSFVLYYFYNVSAGDDPVDPSQFEVVPTANGFDIIGELSASTTTPESFQQLILEFRVTQTLAEAVAEVSVTGERLSGYPGADESGGFAAGATFRDASTGAYQGSTSVGWGIGDPFDVVATLTSPGFDIPNVIDVSLQAIASGPGSILEEGGARITSWSFVVTPEPSTGGLVLLGLAILTAQRRRRR